MLQHFIFWRSRKVQQDSVFDHVPSEMCRAATAAHPTATVQGCRNCHVWGMLEASWGEKPCTAAPHRVRWALLKGCRWDRGYNKGSRQWGSWGVKELWPAWSRLTCGWVTAWVSLRGNVMVAVQLVASRGGEKLVAVSGFLWERALVLAGLATGCSSSDTAQGMEGIHVPASAGCWALVCSWLTKTYWLKLSSEMLLAGKIS